MNIFKSIGMGLIVGFSSVLLHNLYSPFGIIAALLLTFVGVRATGQLFFFRRYQVIFSLAWLLVVIRALVYGNTPGNIFLLGGLVVLLLGLITPKSLNR
jgi:predicted outer membrane lipoprotein